MDLDKYKNIFAQESKKYLEDLGPLLISVEKDRPNRQLWEQIHGKIHSIKGMARALSMENISSLCHLMEDWCKQFQQGTCKAGKDDVQSLFEGVDVLAVLVGSWGVDASPEQKKQREGLMARFEKEPSQDRAEVAIEPENISVHSPKGIE
ncbi:MAG: Hpt domain-containing protein, partial [Desulfobulbaceae bacterium]|nr:Hpt domain-containing protein [Desulfobulbaceae bacterium]